MKTKFQSIVSLFGNNVETQLECREGWDELILRTTARLDKYPTSRNLALTIPHISARDSWRLVVQTVNGDELLDINSTIGNIDGAIDNVLFDSHLEDEITILYKVTKRLDNNVLSVYDESLFVGSISAQGIIPLLMGISNRLSSDLVIEMLGRPRFHSFNTGTINVVGENHIEHLSYLDYRESRLTTRKTYCQWSNNEIFVLPEDLYTTTRDHELSILFRKAACLLSIMYVCDNSILNNNLEIRLCGYRTMSSQVNTNPLNDLQHIDDFCDRWFAIYDWCYTGGYSSDRLSIARNIISLNIVSNDIVKVNETTLQAIKSNFKIFEQDNVRQYIKVRNEISNLLLELQSKVNNIVEGFTGEFKKNILAIYTFFITVVVIRVISKGEFWGGFTNPVIYLSLIFLGISAMLLIYSHIEISTKEKLFEKQYNQLKERYAPLLSVEELTSIFEDCDPRKCGTHANYIQWQKRVYTGLWIASLIVLLLFLIFMLVSNWIASFCTCKITKAVIICCIRNILN